jgi:hypothetical protein
MTGLLVTLSLVLSSSSRAEEPRRVGLERVEILSEDPGSWLHHELPLAHHRPSTAALRFIEQVQPVWRTPWKGTLIGTSLTVQTIQFEKSMGENGLSWSAGVQTKLLCPRGIVAAIHWERNRLHLIAGLSASSMASWQNMHWGTWSVLPTAGIGLSR